MTIIVTGGAGFIGSNFIFHMLGKYPDYRIICLDKLTYAGNLSTLAPVMDKPNFRFVKLDICDREGVRVAPEVFPLVIRAGGGSPRDSLSILDQLLAGAGEGDVAAEEAREPHRRLRVLRHPDPRDHAPGTDDPHRLLVGGHVAHRLEHRPDAAPTGEFAHRLDALLAALGHHVGGPERAA